MSKNIQMMKHNNNKLFQENKSDQTTYDDHERNTMNHGVKNKNKNLNQINLINKNFKSFSYKTNLQKTKPAHHHHHQNHRKQTPRN